MMGAAGTRTKLPALMVQFVDLTWSGPLKIGETVKMFSMFGVKFKNRAVDLVLLENLLERIWNTKVRSLHQRSLIQVPVV